MTPTPRRLARIAITALCAAAPASAAIAAPASAATVTLDKACYVNKPGSANGAPMVLTGAGFGANDPVDLSYAGLFDTVTADANGNFTTSAPAPTLATYGPGTKTTTLTATDENASTMTASTSILSTNLSVSTSPGTVHNVRKDRVTFHFSGFTPGQQIYGFYIHRQTIVRTLFGRASGPCGVLRHRALLFPGGRPAKEVYTVAFESRRHYSRTANPQVKGTLNLFRF